MSNKLIYIADDEVNICNIMKSFLIKEGFQVQTFYDGSKLLDAFKKHPADLLVLDIMMPGMDGYSLCSAIREVSNVPIIIVSAKDSEIDRILGLNLGGDDYLTKPFSPMELVARVKAFSEELSLINFLITSPAASLQGIYTCIPKEE
jgi:DNA-binding response OmpR family regulator